MTALDPVFGTSAGEVRVRARRLRSFDRAGAKTVCLAALLLPLFTGGCLPPAKTACTTSDECAVGHVCVSGTCRAPSADAAVGVIDAASNGGSPFRDVSGAESFREVAFEGGDLAEPDVPSSGEVAPATDGIGDTSVAEAPPVPPGVDAPDYLGDVPNTDAGGYRRDLLGSTDSGVNLSTNSITGTGGLGTGGIGAGGGISEGGGVGGAGGSAGNGGIDGGGTVDVSGPALPPPSCVDAPICADGLSCCSRFGVPGGTFAMGRGLSGTDACPQGVDCPSTELPEHEADVSAFVLDTFEVTVGRFRKFVEYLDQHPGWQPSSGAGASPRIGNSGWHDGWTPKLPSLATIKADLKCYAPEQTWTDDVGANENKPINCIDWTKAFAFCAWDGGRLPSEAEWEFAAAGGDQNRLYAWGSPTPDCSYANMNNGELCAGDKVAPVVVGSTPKGNGRWGHRDLTGNVGEWILDLYAPYTGASCSDCANISIGSYHMARGGCYGSGPDSARAASRGSDSPGLGHNCMGIRCAWSSF
jgi:formylglycine-generating enzyme